MSTVYSYRICKGSERECSVEKQTEESTTIEGLRMKTQCADERTYSVVASHPTHLHADICLITKHRRTTRCFFGGAIAFPDVEHWNYQLDKEM